MCLAVLLNCELRPPTGEVSTSGILWEFGVREGTILSSMWCSSKLGVTLWEFIHAKSTWREVNRS